MYIHVYGDMCIYMYMETCVYTCIYGRFTTQSYKESTLGLPTKGSQQLDRLLMVAL